MRAFELLLVVVLAFARLGASMRTTRGIFDYRVIRTEVIAPNDLPELATAQTFEREEVPPAPSDLSDKGSASAMRRGLIGRLEIPRLNVSVMVMEGDDDATLARAVGHLRETALPWEPGNAVIAGHRDTFFRPLKNVREGDEIRMTTTRGTYDYRVIRTDIVEPVDLWVLAPIEIRSLTLVTCYSFFYIGSAPQRSSFTPGRNTEPGSPCCAAPGGRFLSARPPARSSTRWAM